ncbi:hypothetical protein B0G80_5904 [Paraburkholderia sp. BL6669N2]|nr:hypothetical protein B0G80_5904 [Paraburkholderia sp. BL6669N2]
MMKYYRFVLGAAFRPHSLAQQGSATVPCESLHNWAVANMMQFLASRGSPVPGEFGGQTLRLSIFAFTADRWTCPLGGMMDDLEKRATSL